MNGQFFLDQPVGNVADLDGSVRASDGHQWLVDVQVFHGQWRAHFHDNLARSMRVTRQRAQQPREC